MKPRKKGSLVSSYDCPDRMKTSATEEVSDEFEGTLKPKARPGSCGKEAPRPSDSSSAGCWPLWAEAPARGVPREAARAAKA